MTELEWRRRWKPSFFGQHWRRLPACQESENPPKVYFIKCHFDVVNCCYEALITDCSSTWYESIDASQLQKATQRLNPSVEAPMTKLLEHIRDQMENFPVGTKLNITESVRDSDPENSDLQLSVTSRLAGLPFMWKFKASPADKSLISENLTLPLLTMVSEGQRQQQELFKILAAKDKEINDLRAQGTKSTRRHLETGRFDETVFFNNMNTSKGFEDCVRQSGSDAFGKEGQKLYTDIMMKQAWIQHIPHEDLESLVDETSDLNERNTAGDSWNNRIPHSVISLSPTKSPAKSPAKSTSPLTRPSDSSPEASPAKDSELLRREALERRLQEEGKKDQKSKKKKKMKF